VTNGGQVARPSWQRPPFEPGNLAHRRSGFWTVPTLRPDDRAELEEITAGIWEVLPDFEASFSVAVEQLALRIWRQRRAYADLSENGLVRDGQPASVLGHLDKLEAAIQRDLDALGLTPTSRARLGLDLVRTEDALAQLIATGREIRERREAEEAGRV
jgi:hypothetical protein